jgi:hypothetical protein
MAYDPVTGKVVLFGGAAGNRYLNDTWTYDGKTWTKQSPTTSPAGRAGAGMAYDPNIRKLVLFGALEPVATDTWTYDGTTWIQQHPATSPSDGGWMAYDPHIGKLVLVGKTGTWTYDETTWTPTSAGLDRAQPVTYDAAIKKLVAYGGGTLPGGTTWTYDGQTWTEQSCSTWPMVRDAWSVAYDPAVGQTVLFGGFAYDPSMRDGLGNPANDTWTYNGKTWTKQSPPTAPPPQIIPIMVYAPALNTLVLYAGDSPQGEVKGETWTYGPY